MMFTALLNPGFILVNLSMIFLVFIFIVVVRMKGKSQIHYAFLFLMSTTFIWAVGAMIMQYEFLTGRPTSHWAVSLAYVGLILTPVTVLFIGRIFAKTKIKLSWKMSLFFLVPLLSIILVITNDWHHLFYRYIQYDELTSEKALGSYFLFHTFYSYLCILVGMGYLIFFSVKNAGFFSRQSIFILLGILVSFGYNILLTLQVIKVQFHTNVISFFFTFLFFYLAILKYDLLNIVPIAMQNVVDHISDCFLVIDKESTIIDFNKTFQDTFGPVLKINRKDNLNQLISKGESGPEFTELMVLFNESVAKRQQLSFEKSLNFDGETKYFTIEVTPLYNQSVYLSTIILLKDITQIRSALETIQKNFEILTEKERLASLGQLIGGIAHNLKTPIMSISGGIEGLKDLIDEYEASIGDSTVTNEDHQEIAREMHSWISKIKPHCSYMSDIITTVKGQAAQFNTDEDMTFTLDELIKRVELLMKHELKRFHCLLEIDCPTDQPIALKGQVNSLVQIFDNMIVNSIHAYEGKEGIIKLGVTLQDDHVVFTLKDQGKGIPQAVQDRLFKEMVTTKGKGGTGLGLYMSFATIKGRFGGNMWFESQPDSGTTFYLSIPAVRDR